MLSHISIQNYALIEQLDLDLTPGLTALTGETGSGKSIILGALGLALGERAESGILRNPEVKCIIEAIFMVNNNLKPFFDQHDLDFEHNTYLRREITPNGKSRAFVNDTPVTLAVMKELGNNLIDIHSQQEQQLLTDRRFRFAVLDAYSNEPELLKKYRTTFAKWKELRKELAQLEAQEAKSKADEDYYQFQFQELEAARLEEVDQTSLESQLQELEHADQIQSTLIEVGSTLDGLEQSLPATLRQLSQKLGSIGDWHEGSKELAERLKSSSIELQDIAAECEQLGEEISGDPERQGMIAQQLDELYRLQQKHRLDSAEELIELRTSLSEKLEGLANMEGRISEVKDEIEANEKQLHSYADTISNLRKESAAKLAKSIGSKLGKMALPHATIRFEISQGEELHPDGKDQIRLLFKANKGGDEKDIAKVASGGEKSRVMLALKAALATRYLIPTLILDEIDTGVSGEVALRMAEIMKEMSASVQLITVTHLPQVAAAASHHLKVFKTTDKHATYTHLEVLKDSERIQELAEMLSGKEPNDAAKANAKSLLAPWSKG